jgi:hypothetical protein
VRDTILAFKAEEPASDDEPQIDDGDEDDDDELPVSIP